MNIDDQPYRSISIEKAKKNLLSKGFELYSKFFTYKTNNISIIISWDFIYDFIHNTPTRSFKKNVQNKTYICPDEFEEFLKCDMSEADYRQKVISYIKNISKYGQAPKCP